jgi:glutathione synthase/RimK-type ligase-like ATP-grasp enzyme
MKIAIHDHPGSYSDRWIKYCQENNIAYQTVNCYDNDFISRISEFDGLLWHWDLTDYKSTLAARQLTFAIEKMGIKLFPDIRTSWFYNDKVGQKYLLEAIKAPLVKSYVFYSKKDALEWVKDATFPKVFKLRSGAGSSNVRLVETKKKAKKLIHQAFGRGFHQIDPFYRLYDRIKILFSNKDYTSLKKVITGTARLFISKDVEKYSPREKGYIYFQDLVSGLKGDTRLTVVNDRCFGLKRYCRKGDFRASGTGIRSYNAELLDKEMVKLAFDVADKLGVQSVALDILGDEGNYKITEMSYCFTIDCCDDCEGYWDKNLNWHEARVNPQQYIIEDFLKSLKTPRNERELIKPEVCEK